MSRLLLPRVTSLLAKWHSIAVCRSAALAPAGRSARRERTTPSVSDPYADRQADERAAARYWADTGLVFTTQLGTAIDPRNVKRWLADLCDRAGVRSIRPYDLRHTCASLLLAQGVPARVCFVLQVTVLRRRRKADEVARGWVTAWVTTRHGYHQGGSRYPSRRVGVR
jgi:integrase